MERLNTSDKNNLKYDTMVYLCIESHIYDTIYGIFNLPCYKILILSEYNRNLLERRSDVVACFDKIILVKNNEEDIYETLLKEVSDFSKTRICYCENFIVKILNSLEKRLNLPDKRTDLTRFYNKIVTKNIFKDKNILLPQFMEIDLKEYASDPKLYIEKIESCIISSYPMFLKEVDGAGAQIAEKIDSKEDLIFYLNHFSKSNEYLQIENFLEGKLHNIDCVVKNGKIQFCLITQCLSFSDFKKGKNTGSFVFPDNHEIYSIFNDYTNKIFEILSPVPDGWFNYEAFLNNKKEITLLEVQARRSGGFFSKLFNLGWGIEVHSVDVYCQLGIDYKISKKASCYGGIICFPMEKGIIKEIRKLPTLRAFSTELTVIAKVGDKFNGAVSMGSSIAHVIWKNYTFEDSLEDFEKLKDFKLFEWDYC